MTKIALNRKKESFSLLILCVNLLSINTTYFKMTVVLTIIAQVRLALVGIFFINNDDVY